MSALFDELSKEQHCLTPERLEQLCRDYNGEHFHSGGGIFLGLFNDGPDALVVLSRDAVCRFTGAGSGKPYQRHDRIFFEDPERGIDHDPHLAHGFTDVDELVREALDGLQTRFDDALKLSVTEATGVDRFPGDVDPIALVRFEEGLEGLVRCLVQNAVESKQ